MPIRQSLDSPTHRLLAALLVAVAVTGCADREAAGGAGSRTVAVDDDEQSPASVAVDPCALLTSAEISEQLFLSLAPSERAGYSTPEFDVDATGTDGGMARGCHYRFRSRQSAGGGPAWQSDFEIMLFPSDAIGLAEDRRIPLRGSGAEMFKERGTRAGFYVVKGGLAAALTGFPGRGEAEPGGPDAGRVILLAHIAERLP